MNSGTLKGIHNFTSAFLTSQILITFITSYSLSKSRQPQVKLSLRTRAAKLNPTSLTQWNQRQITGRYSSRSQQNTPKQTGSSCKATGKGIRKTKSAPPSVTKSLGLNSRTTRQNRGLLQADAFIELTSPRRRRRGRHTADNSPDSSPSSSLGFRIVNTTNNELKNPPFSTEKHSPQNTEPKRRGRKRQSAGK